MTSTSGSQHRCVFVGNIPYDASEEQLIQICEEVGPVVSFRLVLDKETGRPKGYGFCEYQDEETALSARRNLQGYEINGRQLRVDFAENDKGVDRNREQGRGGPGLASSTNAQKSLPGQPFVGDAALSHPLGLPLALTAASVMAEALGASQINCLPQFRNDRPIALGSGNDATTNYLAKLSRHQLNEIMLELKALATKNRAQARQLLQESPQLTKALFQAQIMLGVVTPQMMHAAASQQTSGTVTTALQNCKPVTLYPSPSQTSLHKETAIEPFPRPVEVQGKNVFSNSAALQHFSVPTTHIPFHSYRPPLPQNQIPSQGAIPGIAGVPMHPNAQVPLLPTSGSCFPLVHPSVMHHSRTVGAINTTHQPQVTPPNIHLQQSFLPHSLASQIATLNHPLPSSKLEMFSKEARPSGSGLGLTSVSRSSTKLGSVRLIKQNEMSSDVLGLSHLSKRPRLEEGDARNMIGGNSVSLSSDSSLSSGRQISNANEMQHFQKQISQLSEEEESALMQQLMSLTPEQLSSLPSEQQQQVLEIQRTLRSKLLI